MVYRGVYFFISGVRKLLFFHSVQTPSFVMVAYLRMRLMHRKIAKEESLALIKKQFIGECERKNLA